MRLPHVRISVGKLLVVVAVVAVNLGVVRLLYKVVENSAATAPMLYKPLGFASGFLPLINVAMIGTALFAAQKLRSLRGGGREHSPAGMTYFVLHMLALGCVVYVVMPDALDSYLDALDPVMNHVLKGWSALFSPSGDAFPWVVLECLVLGAAISGPALLLSWIGHLVARRCARTLPRIRFWAMTSLISLGFAGVAFAIGVTLQPFADEHEIDLVFQIVDKDSGRPIVAALVRITDPCELDPTSIPPAALTAADGHAPLACRFLTIGVRSAFQTMGVFSPWGRWLEISAAGYQPVRLPLGEVMGQYADLERLRLRKISLARGEAPEETFRDIAGTYSTPSRGFGHNGFKIEPDGRFAWIGAGCMGVQCLGYGYLSRDGGELVLLPTPRLRGEAELDNLMTTRFRSIPWGDRLYLSQVNSEQLQEFCRAVFRPDRPANFPPSYPGYLRESDAEKPRSGLPQLPAMVWAKFLLSQIGLNEDGGLRMALESLLPKNLRKGERRPEVDDVTF